MLLVMLGELWPKILIIKAYNGIGQRLFVLRRHKQTVHAVLHDFVQPADARGNHWLAETKRELRHAALGRRHIRQHNDIGQIKIWFEFLIWHVAVDERHRLLHMQVAGEALVELRRRPELTDHQQMHRVLPGEQYAFRDLPIEHPLFTAQFDVKVMPQIPSIQHWRQYGGPGAPTSERGEDSAVPLIRAITDAHGNIMVLSTHNTDITDAWEREGEDPRYFYQFSPDGYALGINVILYAMTH